MEAPKATLTSDMYSVAMVIWAVSKMQPYSRTDTHVQHAINRFSTIGCPLANFVTTAR